MVSFKVHLLLKVKLHVSLGNPKSLGQFEETHTNR